MIDSKIDTNQHRLEVALRLAAVMCELSRRILLHDRSKLESPEVEIFDEVTEKLRGLTYGSDEYKACLAEMKPALDHHYANNRHHPEHFDNGIIGMTLTDLLEMLCDWMAATKRHADGDIAKSIEINQKRFGYPDELKRIFLNTAGQITKELG